MDHDQGKRKLTHCPVSPDEKMFNIYILKEVSVIVFFQRGEAGRGEVKNPRGRAKVKIRGAGQKSA